MTLLGLISGRWTSPITWLGALMVIGGVLLFGHMGVVAATGTQTTGTITRAGTMTAADGHSTDFHFSFGNPPQGAVSAATNDCPWIQFAGPGGRTEILQASECDTNGQVGQQVPVRYRGSNPRNVDIAGSGSELLVGIWLVLFGAILFAVGWFVGGVSGRLVRAPLARLRTRITGIPDRPAVQGVATPPTPIAMPPAQTPPPVVPSPQVGMPPQTVSPPQVALPPPVVPPPGVLPVAPPAEPGSSAAA